jgi:hypothetical protein
MAIIPQVSLYRLINDTKPLREITPDDLREMARAPSPVAAKERAPLFTPYAAPGKTKAVAEQAPYWLLVLDHDDDGRDLAAMRELYDSFDCAYLVYSTANHYREKGDKGAEPRWRVVLPLSRCMRCDELQAIQKALAKATGADQAATQVQHGFYAPALVGIEPRYEFIDELDRPAFDPDDAESLLRQYIEAAKPKDNAPSFSSVQAEQATPKPRNLLASTNGDLFDKIAHHYRLHNLLTEAGYKPAGANKYLAPGSSTGTAGVVLMADESGTERVFSHHGEHDPLSHLHHNGHALDAFDVLTELHYNGNTQEAMRRAAETVDPEGQKHRQREYMREQEPAEQTKLSRVDLRADWEIPA